MVLAEAQIAMSYPARAVERIMPSVDTPRLLAARLDIFAETAGYNGGMVLDPTDVGRFVVDRLAKAVIGRIQDGDTSQGLLVGAISNPSEDKMDKFGRVFGYDTNNLQPDSIIVRPRNLFDKTEALRTARRGSGSRRYQILSNTLNLGIHSKLPLTNPDKMAEIMADSGIDGLTLDTRKDGNEGLRTPSERNELPHWKDWWPGLLERGLVRLVDVQMPISEKGPMAAVAAIDRENYGPGAELNDMLTTIGEHWDQPKGQRIWRVGSDVLRVVVHLPPIGGVDRIPMPYRARAESHARDDHAPSVHAIKQRMLAPAT
jgi:hypothetical protein